MRNIVEEEMEEKTESLKNLSPAQGLQELTRWAAGAQIDGNTKKPLARLGVSLGGSGRCKNTEISREDTATVGNTR